MKNIKIFDNLFSHAEYSTDIQKSNYIKWIRGDNIQDDNIVFYTDRSLILSLKHKNVKKFAWLLESPLVTKSSYEWIKNNYKYFDIVFTHNKELLKLSDKFQFAPTGGCWIEKKDQNIFNKVKNISIISSNKNYLEGHKLRHEFIKNYFHYIDVYGRGYKNIEYKIYGLKNYRFSVVIENAKIDYYFTEKLIDCFMTGTIPIYWGCPSIGKFFDDKGIITFDKLKDINILNYNEDLYNEMLPYVKKNFEIAKEYLISEDYIWETYFKK